MQTCPERWFLGLEPSVCFPLPLARELARAGAFFTGVDREQLRLWRWSCAPSAQIETVAGIEFVEISSFSSIGVWRSDDGFIGVQRFSAVTTGGVVTAASVSVSRGGARVSAEFAGSASSVFSRNLRLLGFLRRGFFIRHRFIFRRSERLGLGTLLQREPSAVVGSLLVGGFSDHRDNRRWRILNRRLSGGFVDLDRRRGGSVGMRLGSVLTWTDSSLSSRGHH
ncbi:unnamed protein product [Microthlaspi erraticum]|uniref:Uncharacterized protein n=1 Tax=Microthlaspi erraticum TaxID=1685480 RepID=A0A6D2IGJ6_9BRAS|nr:unnamed protein product [Microthlaspi erraticum]